MDLIRFEPMLLQCLNVFHILAVYLDATWVNRNMNYVRELGVQRDIQKTFRVS